MTEIERGAGVPAEPERPPLRQPVRVRADGPARVHRSTLGRDRRRVGGAVRRDELVRPRAVRGRRPHPRRPRGASRTARRSSRPSCDGRSSRSTGSEVRLRFWIAAARGPVAAARRTREVEWPKVEGRHRCRAPPDARPHPPRRREPVRPDQGPPGPRVRLLDRRPDGRRRRSACTTRTGRIATTSRSRWTRSACARTPASRSSGSSSSTRSARPTPRPAARPGSALVRDRRPSWPRWSCRARERSTTG